MSHIKEALDLSFMYSLYYRAKHTSIFCYFLLATNLDKRNIFLSSHFNPIWYEIDKIEKNICKLVFDHHIALQFLGNSVQYNVFYNTSNFNTCIFLYMFGEPDFTNCYVKKMVLSRLFICHTVLNAHLLKICSSFI